MSRIISVFCDLLQTGLEETSKKGRGKRNKEENKEGECQDKLYLCSVSMFFCVCNDEITHVSKQVQRKKSHQKWGNIFHVTAQSWSLLTGKNQSV